MTASFTLTGNRGLDLEEKLIFEQDKKGRTAVDLPEPGVHENRLGPARRTRAIGLPGLSEPQVVRHYVRMSRNNYAIDAGIYPLGSCTMKHNPRLNEKMARQPGLADLHPLQPQQTVQGAFALMDELAHWLIELTGMPAVALSPAAGAHGELTGLMAIRSALEALGDARRVVLVPESAHGTNPASAHMCGYEIESVAATARGRVDLAALKARLGPDVAAVMITNPNTCGLFEDDMAEISAAVHAAGAFVYCDGANFNAIVGRVRPGDLGIDAMHLNLHKTFSTPHGGGGPGSGPVTLSKALAPFAPLPYVVREGEAFRLVEQAGEPTGKSGAHPYGRMKGFHGQFGVFVRALSYMMSMGSDGLRQASADAVLNANYLRVRLHGAMSLSFDGPCMHEVLFDDHFLAETGISTLDFAKAMIDEGVHPMTMYFPLIVHGAFLIEPTETESRASLDLLADLMLGLAARAKAKDVEFFKDSPKLAPRRRLDETRAARNPILRWVPPVVKAAAE